MKLILIGHRGVGKSSLLDRIQTYKVQYGLKSPIYDLDKEVEKRLKNSIQNIFTNNGEEYFRQQERSIFNDITKTNDFIIALGAGFELEKIEIPNDWEIIWVRRYSDKLGRIFFDRPRLNKNQRPLAEYFERFDLREGSYKKYCHWIYDMPEGMTVPSETEKKIIFNKVQNCSGILSLSSEYFKNIERIESVLLDWEIDYFELRDDLLSREEITKLYFILDSKQLLLSFRKPFEKIYLHPFFSKLKSEAQLDWAIELGPAQVVTHYISVHERSENESLTDVIKRLESFKITPEQKLKLAVEIKNFSELMIGIEWQSKDPENRNFLPRSDDGRWKWVRLWLKDRQTLNFFKFGGNSVLDQPSVFEWLEALPAPKSFAAVLGNPIEHSYSYIEHKNYFRIYQSGFFAIKIKPEEWEHAINILHKLGLNWAAITSPLKVKAFELESNKSEIVKELKSVNTLKYNFKSESWLSDNTDFIGLEAVLNSIKITEPIAIWGGGGTLNNILKLFPAALSFSSRTGQLKIKSEQKISVGYSPETVIWAAPPAAELPPNNWKPKWIIDLNYREDSLAREFSLNTGAKYISGHLMFKVQAQKQREFWEKKE